MSLPSSVADFVPCDRLLQEAYLLPSSSRFTVTNVYKWFLIDGLVRLRLKLSLSCKIISG